MVDSTSKFKVAKFYSKIDDSDAVKCGVCPRNCTIQDGARGFCGVKYNSLGILYSLVYGYPAALQVDPIEKKPFAEFMQGTKTFSIGTYGCNLDCSFCQNYHLSREKAKCNNSNSDYYSPEFLVTSAIKHGCKSIAFTYNEPTVWLEYGIDIAKLAKQNDLAVVLVSNGFINKEIAGTFYPLIDAANIDMKGFSEDFYSEMTHGKLKPVLEAIKLLYSLGKHIELTNLVIPGKNDSVELINAYLEWIEGNLVKSVPLHFSAYHPMYKFKTASRTSPNTLYRIRELAESRGFTNVYLGNI